MPELILPVGFTSHAFYFRHSTVSRSMITTFAGDVDAPPFTQANNGTLYNDLVAALAPLYDNAWSFAQLVTLVGVDGPTQRFVTAGASTGSRSSVESASPNVTYLLSKQTGLSGRKFRGRSYLPCSNEQAVNENGSISPTEVNNIQTAAGLILEAFQTGGGNNLNRMVLLHSEPVTPPTTVTLLTAGTFVATQRRRLVRTT